LSGGKVIYCRNRGTLLDSTSDLWEISIDRVTAQPLGTAKRLTSWPRVNVGSPSATADGAHLVVLEAISESQVYVGDLQAGGTHLKGEEATHFPTGWTPDSQAVLIASDVNGSWDVFKQRLDKKDLELLSAGTGFKMAPRLSPDGKWILYTAWAEDETDSTALGKSRCCEFRCLAERRNWCTRGSGLRSPAALERSASGARGTPMANSFSSSSWTPSRAKVDGWQPLMAPGGVSGEL